MKPVFYSIALFLCLFTQRTFAQSIDSGKMERHGFELVHLKDTAVWVPQSTPLRKPYVSNGLDMFILSTANIDRPGASGLTTPRFTAFFHFGNNVHYDFNEWVGIYTGLGIKNIGFIDKQAGVTTKYRAYTIGAPIGIKIGQLVKRNFLFLGGGVDLPFHFKQKTFVNRGSKTKTRDWFSDRTEAVLPYVFAGLSVNPGITFKLQYYPGNFLNTSFIQPGTLIMPYAGYNNTNLILLSLGIDFRYRSKPKMKYVDDGA